jgi:hypothetical protein
MTSSPYPFTSRDLGEEGVDGAEEELLVAWGELVDFLEASEESSVDGVWGVGLSLGRVEGEDLVGGGLEGLSEAYEQGAVEAQVAALVLGDEGLVDAEALGQLGPG